MSTDAIRQSLDANTCAGSSAATVAWKQTVLHLIKTSNRAALSDFRTLRAGRLWEKTIKLKTKTDVLVELLFGWLCFFWGGEGLKG